MPDDFDAHFQSLAPTAPDANTGDQPDFESHFSQLAPGDSTQTNSVKQDNSFIRVPAIFSQGLATGAEGILGTPGAIERLGKKYLGAGEFKPQNALQAGLQKVQNALSLPTPGGIASATGQGLSEHPELTPQNGLEKAAAISGEAIPNAALMMAGGVSPLSAMTISHAQGIGAETGHELAPDNPWVPMVFGVGAGLLTSGGIGALDRFFDRQDAISAWEKADKELGDALDAQQAGFDPSRRVSVEKPTAAANALEIARDDAANNKFDAKTTYKNVTRANDAKLSETKNIGEGLVSAAEAKTGEDFSNAGAGFGSASTPQQAGTVLQEKGANWLENDFPAKLKAAEKPVLDKVPLDSEVDLAPLEGVLKSITGKGGDLKPLVSLFSKNLPKILQDKLTGLLNPDESAEELAALAGNPELAEPVKPVWKDVRELRSAIGDAMSDPKLASDIGESNIDAMYKAVNDALTKTAKKAGAGDEWGAFNKESTRLYSFRNNLLSDVISTKNAGQEVIFPERAALNLLSQGKEGGTGLQMLRDEIPEGADALAALKLREGRKAWDELKPEAKIALVKDPEKAALLDQSAKLPDAAAAAAKAKLSEAGQNHAEILKAAEDDLRTGNFKETQRVRAAQKAKAAESAQARSQTQAQSAAEAQASYDRNTRVYEARKAAVQAKAGLPSTSNPLEMVGNIVKAGIGGYAGHDLGPVVANALGLPSAVGTAITTLGGAAAPHVWRGLKSLVTNPGNVTIPLTGALAGQNALAPNKAKQKSEQK